MINTQQRGERNSLAASAAATLGLMWLCTTTVEAQFYRLDKLVSDLPGTAVVTDAALVNPWGMSYNPTGPFWVSNAGTNTSTLYRVDASSGAVTKVGLTVAVPAPSGQLFNPSADFVITAGGGSGPATFLFAGLGGLILGWNPAVPPPPTSTMAVPAAVGTAPASYTGLAMAMRGSDRFLYAANPAAGRIDVFDKNFMPVALPGTFTDPGLPAGNRPFNVVALGGVLYVTYIGPVGVVNVFDNNGVFLRRFATGGALLNPWGVAAAPAGFGKFSNAILVGNFNSGDPATGAGNISAYEPVTGNFLGRIEDPDGNPIAIDGLWALLFGNGQSGGAEDVLYFTAGIQKETHGLLGSLTACRAPLIENVAASPAQLWPPNHKMVPVTINYKVTDNCTPDPSCSLTVSSNQGAGGGSGNTSPDWLVIDAHHVELRSERAGNADGPRIYSIAISCSDQQGFTTKATATVTVPHDQGKN
ncbi:MAG: TIGR03118 family protein [Acidobacteria bacterium]|nr:TIGR03118 family protein [Acidobacteriota bacterium]